MAYSSLVSIPARNAGRLSSGIAKSGRLVPSRFSRQRTAPEKSKLEGSRLAYLGKSFPYKGLSKRTLQFITRAGTRTSRGYSAYWRRFTAWWNQQNFPDDAISPARVANFLKFIFDQGYGASQCAYFRSAISMTAPHWEGVPLGETFLVSQMMSAIKREHPTKARYQDGWDVEQVLQFIETNWSDNTTITLETLRRKCIMLMRLTSLSRSADIYQIRFSSLAFQASELRYDSRPLKQDPTRELCALRLQRFLDNPHLCPVEPWKNMSNVLNIFRDQVTGSLWNQETICGN
jgi:hypothetical protein